MLKLLKDNTQREKILWLSSKFDNQVYGVLFITPMSSNFPWIHDNLIMHIMSHLVCVCL